MIGILFVMRSCLLTSFYDLYFSYQVLSVILSPQCPLAACVVSHPPVSRRGLLEGVSMTVVDGAAVTSFVIVTVTVL